MGPVIGGSHADVGCDRNETCRIGKPFIVYVFPIIIRFAAYPSTEATSPQEDKLVPLKISRLGAG